MSSYISSYELIKQAKEEMKKIVMIMNNLSDEEFYNKYANDIHFHNGFETLVELFMQAKFD